MPVQFLPIQGIDLAAATSTVVFTAPAAPAANIIVTSLVVVVPIGVSAAEITIHRGAASAANVIASATVDPGERLEIRNTFLNPSQVIRVTSNQAGVVAYGNYSRE
jgi:hypothetical protein